MIEEGKTLDEIAVIRGRRRSTIVSMVSDLVERGLVEFHESWVAEDRQRKIEAAAADLGLERFTPIKEALPEDFTYDEIRLVVANLRRRAAANPLPLRREPPHAIAESGAGRRERSGTSFINFQRDHFEIAHHPVNDVPRDDVKAAHAHQHRNVPYVRDHRSGNDSRK